MATRPEDILDSFQNRNLAPAELVDQLLKRGVHKVADELSQPLNGMKNSNFLRGHQTQGLEGAQIDKEHGAKTLWGPSKHSIKEVSEELTGGAVLKAALQEYRRRLTEFKEQNDRPTESKLGLLERHLFKGKFGYATLDN